MKGGKEQFQQQAVIEVPPPKVIIHNPPPPDNTMLVVTGTIIVPLLIAGITLWFQHKWRKDNPGMPMTLANLKKSREK